MIAAKHDCRASERKLKSIYGAGGKMSSEKHIMKRKKSTVSFLCATWYFDYGMCVCTIFFAKMRPIWIL